MLLLQRDWSLEVELPQVFGGEEGWESEKVYLIYMLLMCTLLMLAVAPGYLILVLLLIFATQNRGYGLSEDWLRTR